MPSIYVASLSDYNNGRLHGEWIDLDDITEREELDERIAAILRGSHFPNVTVACPECHDGKQSTGEACETCHGTGTVQSAEEWAIHDYDGFSGLSLGENPDLDDVIELAAMLEEHGDAWVAYQDVVSDDGSEDDFNDRFMGEHDTEAAWAEQYAEDTDMLRGVPDNLRRYFDYEAYARDCRLGGDVDFVRVNGTLYVFRGN